MAWIPHTSWGCKERLRCKRTKDSHATRELGLGQSSFNAVEGGGGGRRGTWTGRGRLNPERQLGLGGIHHLSHEEGRLGVSIVDDVEERSVELDLWGKGHGDGFQNRGPGSFCPFLVDGQSSLVERLEGGGQRGCV